MNKEKIIKESLNNVKVIGGVILLAFAARVLANNLWTDHESNDPGITEVDLLAYTIGDDKGLGHRYYRQKKHQED